MSRRARRPQQPAPARTPAAPIDLVQAVVEAIARGELDGELGVLGAVINERVRQDPTGRGCAGPSHSGAGNRPDAGAGRQERPANSWQSTTSGFIPCLRAVAT